MRTQLASASKERATAQAALVQANAVQKLQVDLAIARTKMECGGLMLSHFTGGGMSGGRPASAATAAATPGSAGPTAGPTPLPRGPDFSSFFSPAV